MTSLDALDWTEATAYADNAVSHGYRSAPFDGAVDLGVPDEKLIMARYAMLEPGGFITNHVDGLKEYYCRFHLPLEPAGWYWDERVGLVENPDELFEVRHWLNHAVGNPTDRRRIHVVFDTLPVIHHGQSAGAVHKPWIPQIRTLVERLQNQ